MGASFVHTPSHNTCDLAFLSFAKGDLETSFYLIEKARAEKIPPAAANGVGEPTGTAADYAARPDFAPERAKHLFWLAAREELEPGTVLLSYCVAETRTLLFVLEPGRDLHAKSLSISAGEIREDVHTLRDLIEKARPRSAFGRTPMQQYRQVAKDLYRSLFGAVEDRLAAAERLLIVTDDALHFLPFAALVREASGTEQFLIEWKSLHFTSSVALYSRLRQRPAVPPDSSPFRAQLVAFADPVYPSHFSAEARERITDSPLRSALARGFLLDWAKLPASRQEVERIAALFPIDAVFMYLAEAATEERVKSLARLRPRIVHFATHGFVDRESPLDSGLALTIPQGLPEHRENGLLQIREISEHLRLEANLVVLSACETGLGQIHKGRGVISLAQAFHLAGARSVVSTLWQVVDETTSELMIRFYRHLRSGVAKDEALRQAQLELIRAPVLVHSPFGRVRRDASAPYHWAGFKLSGLAHQDG